ncbi:MAG: anti-sigma factor [Actinomycetota bacterium]|nr:anti-sigma factor [Actinomycetota bacterium]
MKEAQHEEIKGLIAPYVLGAVSPDEEALIRTHLRSCDECRAEAEGFEPVTASLAAAVDPVELPAGFAERTLQRVREDRGDAAAPAPALAPARRPRLAWVFSAAALLIVAVVVALVALGGGGGTDPGEVAALLEEPGLDLSAGDVEAKVVETDDGTVFVARGLDAAPEGKIYELWQMKGSCAPGEKGPCDVEPSVTFEPEDGVAMVEVPASLDDFSDAAVTVEEGFVDQPTSDPVLSSF